MTTSDLVLEKYRSKVQILSTIAIVIGALITIAGGYTFIQNNFWRPKIKVLDVDYSNQTAKLLINGIEKHLYDGSTLAAGGSWGVRFGKNNMDANRIELVKNNLVDSFINVKK